MLMALGPFRFTVPVYSVEEISRHVEARVASQPVIGARPPTHLLGPGEETVKLASTFHPLHLNRGGLFQLEGVRAACIAQTPLMMVSIAGAVFGRWIIKSVDDERSMFAAGSSVPQTVTVDMGLIRYVGRGGFRAVLMPRPFFQIFAGGVDVTSRIMGGGISLTITDGVGMSSDTVQLSIDDQNGVVAPPRTGVELRIVAGYVDQPVDFGTYIVDEVNLEGWPQTINVSAKSAKAKSAVKQRRPKSYEPPDYPTYQKIFSEIAGRNGLTLSISSEIGSKSVTFEAQAEEDDIAFLSRIGLKLDASVSIKNNNLIAVKRGKGASAGGAPLPAIRVTGGRFSNVLSYNVSTKDQPKHKKAKATYFDRKKAKREEVEKPAGTDGPDLLLREPYQNKKEAEDAAEAAGKEAKRAEGSASFKINGDPTARAEAYVIVTGIRSLVDGTWRSKTVTHNFSSDGPYTTSIECELPG